MPAAHRFMEDAMRVIEERIKKLGGELKARRMPLRLRYLVEVGQEAAPGSRTQAAIVVGVTDRGNPDRFSKYLMTLHMLAQDKFEICTKLDRRSASSIHIERCFIEDRFALETVETFALKVSQHYLEHPR